jgi:hypothetical protein
LLSQDYKQFLKWDYIGAPWKVTNGAYTGINEAGVSIPSLLPDYRVGNGGLSMRSVSAMLYISQNDMTSSVDEQEDLYFVKNLHKYSFRIADLQSASQFALEVKIPEINTNRLFGMHQSWLYVNDDIHKNMTYQMLNDYYGTSLKKMSFWEHLLVKLRLN